MRVSVILPLMDETVSLRSTVAVLLAENRAHLSEILIVVCDKTSPDALQTAEELRFESPSLIRIRSQKRPYLGGALRDGFEWSSGTHIVMMASDLETDPATVKDLIARASEGYDIVTATRWGGGGFRNYNLLKYALNWIFQRMFSIVYGTKLSDLTFGFRIFKAEWVKCIQWEELRHPFFLESLLKPVRLGAKVAEIPTTWRARREGVSHNSFLRNFGYFRIALKIRFRDQHHFLISPLPTRS